MTHDDTLTILQLLPCTGASCSVFWAQFLVECVFGENFLNISEFSEGSAFGTANTLLATC